MVSRQSDDAVGLLRYYSIHQNFPRNKLDSCYSYFCPKTGIDKTVLCLAKAFLGLPEFNGVALQFFKSFGGNKIIFFSQLLRLPFQYQKHSVHFDIPEKQSAYPCASPYALVQLLAVVVSAELRLPVTVF